MSFSCDFKLKEGEDVNYRACALGASETLNVQLEESYEKNAKTLRDDIDGKKAQHDKGSFCVVEPQPV